MPAVSLVPPARLPAGAGRAKCGPLVHGRSLWAWRYQQDIASDRIWVQEGGVLGRWDGSGAFSEAWGSELGAWGIGISLGDQGGS